ncbi:hypothetical protein [Clostridium sp. DJ247]|uniref:hypothetical protein n=1 Tax=Clostridium sp. DJ247 TaxID=2726188 RepID=UPI00162A4460|nr:hypothetical protein [Clostridium sp. DJ247]MBC2580480.1 hypothetical protein [Clostridium sp. DJ247]
MFLNELSKRESIAFVNLVEALANIDEVFAENEKDLVKEYIEELSLDGKTIEKLTVELALKELKTSTDRVKNIIYFELLGLALIDGEYDQKEIDFLDNLAVNLSISSKKQQEFINYFKTVKETYEITFVNYENKLESLKKAALDLL